jgi:Base plate wedge protein 53
MDLLKQLPKITYQNYTVSDLLVKIATVKQNLAKFTGYYQYSIKDGERPDTIAYDYYGSSEYAWLVLIYNDIIDPYMQWPLDQQQFHSYLFEKYQTIWETKSMIDHYIYTGVGANDPDVNYVNHKLTAESFDALSVDDRAGWTAVYVYDVEQQINENKRSIKLLSNSFLKQVDRELVALLQ